MNLLLIFPILIPTLFLLLALRITPTASPINQASSPQLAAITPTKTPQVLSASTTAPTPSPSPTQEATPIPTIYPAELPPPITNNASDILITAINQYRFDHNLALLNTNSAICQAATTRASEAASNFSHDQFYQHLQQGDFNSIGYTQIGENLWQGPGSSQDIISNWSTSDGHRQNLEGDWTMGCGAQNGDTIVYLFAK